MPYAILTPDGSAIYRIIHEPLPDGSQNYAAFGVLPVNDAVPEGKRRTGWQIVNGVAEPVLEDAPIAQPPAPDEAGAYQIREAMILEEFFTPSTPAPDYQELDNWVEGLIDQAIPIAQAAAQNAAAKRAWRTATVVKRSNSLVPLVAAAAGKTEEQVSQLFRTAVTI